MKAHDHISRRRMVQWLGASAMASMVPFPSWSKMVIAKPVADVPGVKNTYFAYRSFWPELDMTATFADMGITTRCFFASNTINSLGFEYCKYPPIWEGIKQYNFDALDQQVNDLLNASPNAKLMCLIDLNTPYWLTRKFAYDSFSEISLAASDQVWLELTTEWMKDFIAYAEEKYGDRITAYILSGGGTSEWYEYDRGRTGRAKTEAWRKWGERSGLSVGMDVPGPQSLRTAVHDNFIYDPATEMDKVHYWRFHNEVVAEAVLHFGRESRAVIPESKEIGVFFGYYLVSDDKLVSFSHLDYERVFASPDIDFVISPGNYDDRMIGGGSGPQLVLGTLQRFGKRYLHEIDHATHVTEQGSRRWESQAEDIAGNLREAAFALVNDASLWWFDMWGGRYVVKETQEQIARMKVIFDEYRSHPSPSVAEVLLIADPQSAYYVNDKHLNASAMARQFRDKLNRIGTPFDTYSFNDIPFIDLSRYKVICMPATLLITPEREVMLKKYVLRKNRTVLWAYAPGICDSKTLDVRRVKTWTGVDYSTPGPVTTPMGNWNAVYAFEFDTYTPSALRAVLATAGVHLYIREEIPVYANEKLVAIHMKEGGSKVVSMPRKYRQVIDLVTGKVVAKNKSSFTYTFRSPETVIFQLEA